MATDMQQLYASSNGDRWFLFQNLATGRATVRHEPAVSSGGLATDTDADVFLSRGGDAPEQQALRRHLEAEQAKSPKVAPQDEAPITAPQIRAGRGLLGWSQDTLARHAGVEVADLAGCESGHTWPTPALLDRVASALAEAGVILIGEGEVTEGGPGVRMGALGTSTGKSLDRSRGEGNDNADRSGGPAKSSRSGN